VRLRTSIRIKLRGGEGGSQKARFERVVFWFGMVKMDFKAGLADTGANFFPRLDGGTKTGFACVQKLGARTPNNVSEI
jgi:hypothetical protein